MLWGNDRGEEDVQDEEAAQEEVHGGVEVGGRADGQHDEYVPTTATRSMDRNRQKGRG